MQLNSYVFILTLLPITLFLYFTLGRIGVAARKLIICLSGIVFYLYAGVTGTVILILCMVVNFILTEMMVETAWIRKPALIVTIGFNLLVLFVFKYANFAISEVNLLTGKNIGSLSLAVPIGISFLIFQQIAYVVNVYSGKIEKTNLLDYLAYILYFPKLVMGPVVDPVDLIGQMNDRANGKWNWDNFISGIKLFCFGLFKKMVIADTFALAVSWGKANVASASSLDWIVLMLSFTFEIYFDFSGYCDMATGISNMMNLKLPINFDSPYKALSVRDFCRRWHVSLSGFFRQYIYFPLGGSRKGMVRTWLNVLIVFIISGIWHGAGLNYVLCGLIFGILCILDRMTGKITEKIFKPVRWLVTFFIVNVLWLLFNASGIGEWLYSLRTMIMGKTFTLSSGLSSCFRGTEMPFFEKLLHLKNISLFTSGTGWLVIFMAAGFFICLIPDNNYNRQKDRNVITMVLAAVAFAWSFLYLGTETSFIYSIF